MYTIRDIYSANTLKKVGKERQPQKSGKNNVYTCIMLLNIIITFKNSGLLQKYFHEKQSN